MKRFVTQFTGRDGHEYAGPMILADSYAEAEAILATCVKGPDGQDIDLIGEWVHDISIGETHHVEVTVRQRAN